MLYVVKMGWKEMGDTSRIDEVLSHALREVPHITIDTLTAFIDLCSRTKECMEERKILFAVALAKGGVNHGYGRVISYLSQHETCLDGYVGAVLVDGADELFTKKLGRQMVFIANRAGCIFPGKPLVEATVSLYNFTIQANVHGLSLIDAYKKSSRGLVEKLMAYDGKKRLGIKRVLALHASSRRTSNSLLLWEMVKSRLENAVEVEEISLRNGTLVDCRGCSYETCLHFGEKGDCFYGGLIVEDVYPAIRRCDAIVLICPNYNDSVGANIMAFFNRLTALFRTDWETFASKAIYGLIVSGYSGGDIVAEQIIDALNCNKNFILPSHFALMETANDPKSILRCDGIEERAALMAKRIREA